ncbi:NADPH-dependent assimilatory sulfite reductase flavoprotein subunit [Candidatus Erwinia haradaeae]|uniref:Sulfite reductase [NADPH] flavoprotein alpha-component n=1 Tax=Candidatus Erwinia haradaeae TaxID=1922217 RepID=A0A451D3J2_9GAMM|nr:NADPH-dependent assimilatory sulfite reductase flavoprotein subunit [Candidatus Erwinia haradaeae]VFP80226.1 Sulfite reductase [NADPH] flavoprotein alpha-component [Candidatus Erwinia haradaeae]
MTIQEPIKNMFPLNSQHIARIQEITGEYSAYQLAWLSGYFWGLRDQKQNLNDISQLKDNNISTITIVSASQTGNARNLAEQLHHDLLDAKLNANLISARDYKFKNIDQEKLFILITCTQGNGEPPEEAIALHRFLMSKKAPKMHSSAYAVFGLGDTSYELFSQAGKEFDKRLSELGAERLLARVDADLEYSETAHAWRIKLIQILKKRILLSSTNSASNLDSNTNINIIQNVSYDKDNPFCARLLMNQKITGRGSNKDIRHIEIDLMQSQLQYKPGDALGVWFENNHALVQELLNLLSLTGEELVTVQGRSISIAQALRQNYELTVNTIHIVEKYAKLSQNPILIEKIKNKHTLQEYVRNTPIVDMVRYAPSKIDAETFISLLRPNTPRLYSISSSQDVNKNEVHITVNVIRFYIDGRIRTGGASGYLADSLKEDDEIRIFIKPNNNFRLPSDPNTPIIMIGPGTGIAPFRAFMQQREKDKATGKNWIFFGNPHFTEDFLYQIEWQKYVKDGLLTRIDLAWSRDQDNKVYVQNKIYDNGKEIWNWIQEGANIYICGDAKKMAKDVEKTLLKIISQFGKIDISETEEFLNDLRIQGRYQRDVY